MNDMRDAMKRALPKRLDDLFTSQAERDEEKLAKIRDIPLSEIDDFPDHPYHVKNDEDMSALVESIKERGVITPAVVRRKEDGRYELVSGHRRRRACELLGLNTLPCEIKELTRDEATILMVDSNLQRSVILPSERAFAYKMKLDAMKRQGARTDLTSSQLGTKLRADDELAQQVGSSRNQIQRFIRLTNLIPPLLDLVDEGRIKLTPAVELSYLSVAEQSALYETISDLDATPSQAQAKVFRELSEKGELTARTINEIMSEEKPNQKEQFRMPRERISKYFPRDATPRQIEDTIIRALEMYERHKERENER